MAKKAKRKKEDDPAPSFQFPVFDASQFLAHESEMTVATTIALLVAVGLGVLSWALESAGTPWFVPVVLAFAIMAALPVVLPKLRTTAAAYTKGDWAGLVLMELFGWLGFWFLFADVLHVPA